MSITPQELERLEHLVTTAVRAGCGLSLHEPMLSTVLALLEELRRCREALECVLECVVDHEMMGTDDLAVIGRDCYDKAAAALEPRGTEKPRP